MSKTFSQQQFIADFSKYKLKIDGQTEILGSS